MQVIKKIPPHYNEYLEYVHKLAECGLVSSVTYEDWLIINKYDNANRTE